MVTPTDGAAGTPEQDPRPGGRRPKKGRSAVLTLLLVGLPVLLVLAVVGLWAGALF